MDVEVKMAVKTVIVSLLFVFSTGAWGVPSPAADANQLLHTLYVGVNQCFNPNQSEAIQQTKKQISELTIDVQKAAQDWATGDRQKIAMDARNLSVVLKSFDESPGLPASLYCSTKRKCLELGFEGNAKYSNCLPVNGDIHRNIQYRSFEKLLDQTLPALIAMLQQVSPT